MTRCTAVVTGPGKHCSLMTLACAGVKAELSERLRGRFGLTKSAPVPAQLLASVAGWTGMQTGRQPQPRRRGRAERVPRYRLRWRDGCADYSTDSREGYSGGDSDGYGSDDDYPGYHQSSTRHLSNPRQPAGGPAAPRHPPQNQPPPGGCAGGCANNTPALACPHRMCGSCCRGCARHVK